MEKMKKSTPRAERGSARSAQSTKKPYVKPEMKQVSLRPEEAVLGGCKVQGSLGAGQPTCHAPAPCSALTS